MMPLPTYNQIPKLNRPCLVPSRGSTVGCFLSSTPYERIHHGPANGESSIRAESDTSPNPRSVIQPDSELRRNNRYAETEHMPKAEAEPEVEPEHRRYQCGTTIREHRHDLADAVGGQDPRACELGDGQSGGTCRACWLNVQPNVEYRLTAKKPCPVDSCGRALFLSTRWRALQSEESDPARRYASATVIAATNPLGPHSFCRFGWSPVAPRLLRKLGNGHGDRRATPAFLLSPVPDTVTVAQLLIASGLHRIVWRRKMRWGPGVYRFVLPSGVAAPGKCSPLRMPAHQPGALVALPGREQRSGQAGPFRCRVGNPASEAQLVFSVPHPAVSARGACAAGCFLLQTRWRATAEAANVEDRVGLGPQGPGGYAATPAFLLSPRGSLRRLPQRQAGEA